MATVLRRHRSSTTASSPPESTKSTAELHLLLDNLANTARIRASNGYPSISTLLEQFHSIRLYLNASSEASRANDNFRHLHGFQILLDTLRVFSGFYHPSRRTSNEKIQIFDLLENALGILSQTFRNHHGNRKYFGRKVEGGGWAALEQTIASIGIGGSEPDLWSEAQLFGRLLAFALDDRRFTALCQAAIDVQHSDKHVPVEDEASETSQVSLAADSTSEGAAISKLVNDKLGELLKEGSLLQNADIVPTIMDFWKTIPRQSGASVNPISLVVIQTLNKIASISNHNLQALHATGILSMLLPMAFDAETPLASIERQCVENLCGSLMALGVNTLNDAQYLVCSKSPVAGDFLLKQMKDSHGPAYIQFDMSLHGYASVELPSLGRSFPPSSNVPGYTFSAWIHIDQFDSSTHTTIFGAFDTSQTCFLLVYLEKDSRNLILQTSVFSSRPSVRFKSTVFESGRWYHITLVHKRPKTLTTSKASLYVNGEFAEQVKCQYPSPPPLSNVSTESFASFGSSSGKANPVQAFLGTPQDLSSRLGQGVVFSRWSLASAHLFEDVISEDLIAVYYRLGPRYNGNFQDCLGSFQTYEASAALGMRNELLHTGKDENSDILGAIREKASTLVPESRIILGVVPSAVMGDGNGSTVAQAQVIHGLNRSASNNLFQLTRNSGTSIAINTAVPCINDALTRQYGTAMLAGQPIVVVPQSIDDSLWRLGGFAGIALKLVEKANSKDDIVRAVDTVFEYIKGSWRNSEAMEREDGYAILGALIRGKIGAGVVVSANSGPEAVTMSSADRDSLGFQLLSLVLDFVGYCHEKPEESYIINPLAYRILLVDFDMWRKTASITQCLYYKQFIVFGVNSKFHHFNSRRLLRMRIVKRFLDALKAETFAADVFPSFIEALITLVKCNPSTDVFRSLALFVTYAYHKPTNTSSKTPRKATGTLPYRSGTTTASSPRRPTINTMLDIKDISLTLTKRQVGTKVLEMYSDLLCEKGNTSYIKRFARTVTNKVFSPGCPGCRHCGGSNISQWLLHLLTEDDPEVVVHGTKILARLLVVHGSSYVTKFATKTGGFAIMQHRLRRWWDLPTIWPICFSILFGHDVAEIDFERSFDLFNLLDTFTNCRVVYPGVLPVIMSMLQNGLKDVLHHQDDPDSPLSEKGNGQTPESTLSVPAGQNRRRSMSLTKELESRQTHQPKRERIGGQAFLLHTVIRFFADLHLKFPEFREYAVNSEYIRLLLTVLFPVVVSTDAVSPETELNSRDSALTFEGDDVMIKPLSREASALPAPIVRTSMVETMLPPSPTTPRARPLRRGSSFILLTSRPSEFSPSSARLNLVTSPKKKLTAQKICNSLVEGLLELVVNVFIDQVTIRKEFPGFNLYLKIPPGFQEHQAYFESYLLRNTISQLSNSIQLDQKSLWEPKMIQNMARFIIHIGEAIFEGWFLSGAESLLDFAGNLLEYFHRPEISKIKTVRLCSQAILTIKHVFLRVALLRLSELDSTQVPEEEALSFMNKLLYWQTVVLSPDLGEEKYLKLICYQLYLKLVDSRESLRLAAANLWRILLVQKPEETSMAFHNAMTSEHRDLSYGFKKLVELDNETFVAWIDQHRTELDALFFGAMSRSWDDFVNTENEKTEETSKNRIVRRREKLRQWHTEDLNEHDIILRHQRASTLWMKNIHASEHLRHQRSQQDQQDNFVFLAATFSKIDREMHRSCAIFDNGLPTKWKLDRTEGRNRMRLRMLPDRDSTTYDYQPKRRATDAAINGGLKLNTKLNPNMTSPSAGATPLTATASATPFDGQSITEADLASALPDNSDTLQDGVVAEEDFELVDDPNDPGEDDAYEDKNRKVMRCVQRGDSVQQVFNISRIIGLEACEGLLIIGKTHLYLMDNVFQRSDGEIVNASQAPVEERDPYLQLIAGQKTGEKQSAPVRAEQEVRSWRWSDVISISKRRFLFRDVAVEVFFTDGRSYLLTAISALLRDELFSKLTSKAPHTTGTSSLPNPEDGWRLEALKVAEELPATFGSKFGNIFNSSAWNPAMRRWAKGEVSNFHYLMLVNTMAGRTFNDLTQYPVFPWVIADYTSEELDLNNPATFRDLSKPMGAQHNSRAADFIERYKSFAEMGDHNAPAFHYGTHYSSAMIVTSYLIRLQPFVQSYLLLQGGNFDHPDRLFYSIEKAWQSASKDNMTDVRELIPEFFYLPEFLTNNNGYNFGLRQGNAGGIDTVQLPPWAKGDPKIFVEKNREALESPYVSRHLHQWIDLIFGCKQRGEAAIEAVNVFHHLSYHGAKDLDNIVDPVERHATIGIIHNFGQTPHQVFSKPHQGREDSRNKIRRLDTSADVLTRLPFPLLESGERVASLIYSPKLDRLLCATAFRLNLPPHYDKYLEWGFADNSVRFYLNDSRKLVGLFENLHQGQLSTAIFASSQLLITAGEDCVLSAHTVVTAPSKPVELIPRSSLFGHRTPVTVLAVSKSFSTLLSASTDGTVLLWDLNHLTFVRKLASGKGVVECAAINEVTGDIMLCRAQKVTLYTLNGEVILEQGVGEKGDHEDYIASCAWYEGTGNEWLEASLLFTGQRGGVVNVWKKAVSKSPSPSSSPSKLQPGNEDGKKGKWCLELVKRLDHVDRHGRGRGESTGTAMGSLPVPGAGGKGKARERSRSSMGGSVGEGAAITCIRPMAQCVYTGDEDGRVFEWDIVQRER